MNQDIVKFKADSGQEVVVTPQDVSSLICPQADQKEVALFLAHCQAHRLDPFTKEAYLIKYGSQPASIVTNYNVFNARAQRFPDYEGIEDGVVIIGRDGEIHHRAGSAVYAKLGEQLLGGWARVFRTGKKPTYVELALSDYSTGKAKWATSPGMMIDKCAKSAAWRTAYPSEFNGMYSAEEMDQAQHGTVEVQATVEPAPAPAAPQVASADISPITSLVREYMVATGFDKVQANRALCEYSGVHALRELTSQQVAATAEMMRGVIAMAQAPAEEVAPEVTVTHLEPEPEPQPAPWDEPAHQMQIGEEGSF